MLSLNAITVRLGGRLILDRATAALPPRQPRRAGRAQRRRQIDADEGRRRPAGGGRGRGRDAAGDADRLYRAGDAGRRRRRRSRPCSPPTPSARPLLHDAETTLRSPPARRDPRAAERDRRPCRPGPRRADPGRPRLRRGDAAAPARQLLGRVADAGGARRLALLRARPAAARRAFEPSRSRSDPVAGEFPALLSAPPC